MSHQQYQDVYNRYLKRFEGLFGALGFDDVVRYQGRLISKMPYEEFVDKWQEYRQLQDYLRESMSKGYTLNDEVNRTYEAAAAAILETPKDFSLL